jgi:hypothetical protein
MKKLHTAARAAWFLTVVAAGCQEAPATLGSSPVWSAQLGGAGYQSPVAVTASADGVVMGGIYDERFTVADREVAGTGGLDGVVASFDAAGGLRWLRELAGPAGDDAIVALKSAPSGAVFVAGHASPGATFAGRTLTADGGAAALLAKLTSAGDLAWAITGRGAGYQSATAVALGPDGDVYFAGDFTQDLDLGQGPATANTGADSFLARFTSDGDLRWVKTISGEGDQHIKQLVIGADGELTLIGYYTKQLAIEAHLLPRNAISDFTPFVARFHGDGSLGWLQTGLLPPAINHIGHEEGHSVDGHAAVSVQDLSVSVAPSGEVSAGVTYGNQFGQGDHDFEAAKVDNLTVTRMGANGGVLVRRTLNAPKAILILGQVVAHDDREQLALSWTGRLPALGASAPLDSDQHRSLALLDLLPDGRFVPKTVYSIDAVGLTSSGAERTDDGSILMAVSWRDMYTLDEDVFLARFR